MTSYLSCERQSVDLHFAKGYLTGRSENGTGMDNVRLLSTQAGEHTAYTTSRLSVAATSRSTMDRRRDKPRRGNQGNKRNQNRDRSCKRREKERRGGRG